MKTLLDRFLRYVRVSTQADDRSTTYPSSPGQINLGRILANELRAMGARNVEHDEHGLVWALIPSTVSHSAPTIAFNAHLDTSPETSGIDVKPMVHENYHGLDIVLPGDSTKVLLVGDNPDLAALKGKTIVTTDGTTLLGGDDKAGVAVIMETAAQLLTRPDIAHGPIRVLFTCDEEIGHGVDHVNLEKLGAVVAYTLDGGGVGEIDGETFSADLATVTITGVNIHPSIAKGRMINAIRLAGLFIERLPRQILSPETTSDRAGFLHPYRIDGGVGSVTLRILLRDFITARLVAQAQLLGSVAQTITAEYPQASIDVAITPQYRNMADGLAREPRALAFAEQAMRKAGLQPRLTIVRGGTDGSRFTELGLPTPNLSTGEHNIHSPLEWTCLEEMAQAVRVNIELAMIWGQEKG
jgi:tripeptide aminopeptidase